MTLTPHLRKFALTAHVVFSVGWLGAVAAFLVLSIAGLNSRDTGVVAGAYLSMNLIGLYVIVPMSLASLATGLVQALGTQWGLFRHYWVLMKFLLALLATYALLRDRTLGRCQRRGTGVARGHNTVGIQTVGIDALRATYAAPAE